MWRLTIVFILPVEPARIGSMQAGPGPRWQGGRWVHGLRPVQPGGNDF